MKAQEQRIRCEIYAFHCWFEPTMQEMNCNWWDIYRIGHVYLNHYSILSYLVVWEAQSLFSLQFSFSFISSTNSSPFSVHHYRRRTRQSKWLSSWKLRLWITQCYVMYNICNNLCLASPFLPPKNHIWFLTLRKICKNTFRGNTVFHWAIFIFDSHFNDS